MLDKEHFKDLVIYILLIGLFILAVFVIKPIIYSVIYGLLLGFIFYPVYNFLLKRVKNDHLAASLVGLSLVIVTILIATFVLTSLLKQAIDFYLILQKLDLLKIINSILPSFISTSELSTTIAGSLNTALSQFITDSISTVSSWVVNSPIILLHLFIVIFIFYFTLKDGKRAIEYIKSLSLFKKETEDKVIKQFSDITASIIYGQIVIGIIEGIVCGIGFFIFGIDNALVLMIIAMFTSIIPVIGPWLIWVPVDIYLFSTGQNFVAIGLLIYGLLIINVIDTIIKPIIIAKRTRISSTIIVTGMIGGIFMFGIIGLVIGPLILAYVLLVIELYRKRAIEEDIIFKKPEA